MSSHPTKASPIDLAENAPAIAPVIAPSEACEDSDTLLELTPRSYTGGRWQRSFLTLVKWRLIY
jgi:hypothetical protein